MRHALVVSLLLLTALGLAACGGSGSGSKGPAVAQCADGRDNDNDGLVDFPADPGCSSAEDTDETDQPPLAACSDNLDNDDDGLIDFPADPGCEFPADNDETDPVTPAACSDGEDNDADGKIDFPDDPGCDSAADDDETDPASQPACSDGEDNDADGKTDFPADPGCTSATDDDETDPAVLPACGDGVDNDADGKIDFPDDPGCDSAADTDEADAVAATKRTRYAMNNACWALKANGSGNYVVRTADGYVANTRNLATAEPFFLKPTALGKYALYNRNRQLMSASGSSLGNVASIDADDTAEWTVVGVGDVTSYPPTPAYNIEPTPEQVARWHGFVDPNLEYSAFTLYSALNNRNLVMNGNGTLAAAAPGSSPANESFSFEPTSGCAQYPEAQSNFSGQPFKGAQPNGNVLGHADVHTHISATEFLGGGHWGRPFHKFGVEHALGNCAVQHGSNGQQDLIGGLLGNDTDGHATDGWPTFTDWPSRNNLTHEAIYWKWVERAWAGGLRVIVNDLVDNETLCELQRNAIGDPLRDCNSMTNAGEQAGTMYGMENYIDAQYGGPGKGFFQIVHSPEEGRAVIEDGKIAVVLGIEISNLFNCKLHYSPLRTERPYNESGNGGPLGLLQNSYECTVEEGKPNSILTQMQRIHDWGVRQIISIHEFDNAFGGNGIFDGLILNLGSRENSGGIPSGDLAGITGLLTGNLNPDQVATIVNNLPTTETPTGEWWTTYNCPVENETPGFSGYLWGNTGGSTQELTLAPFCIPMGQDGRAGGVTPCYPANVRQCNARWMTPAGLYTYSKMMELGFLFDWDHMELGMKTQALELAEAQSPVYPFVSTHGTFGGTSVDQAQRMLANGGILYPSNGSSTGFRGDMAETVGIYNTAMAGVAPDQRPLFGFGYGTDTNGLSSQSGPRNNPTRPVTYPFRMFDTPPFTAMQEFNNTTGVIFNQPASADAEGNVKRTWSEDLDGNAHYGMLSDWVQEIVLDGTSSDVRNLFNSAEAYLQTWQRTEASSAAIRSKGLKQPVDPILRAAPPIGDYTP